MTALAEPRFAHPRTRELAEFLAERRADLGAAVDEVPAELRGRRPAPDRWSTAEVLEHLALLEGRVVALLGPAVEEARTLGTAESEASSVRPRLDADALRDRGRLLQAPAPTQPSGSLDADAAWAALGRARAALLGTLAAGDGLALGAVTRPHPLFGLLDVYQWALAVGGHETRHADQIREVAAAFRAEPSSEPV